MKSVAIITDFRAVSFREVSRAIGSVLKKAGMDCKLYDVTHLNIKERNVLFVGNIFHLTISYVQRFMPQQNVVFYAVTEGDPILDSVSLNLAKDLTFVTPSLFTKKCLENVGLTCRDVIPHGILLKEKYDKRFYDYLKMTLPQPSKVSPSNVFLCVAGNWRRKALDQLMVAAKTVEKVVRDFFLILHSGIGHTNIVAMQENLQLKRFWFTNMWGTLPRAKLASLYALCDAYVQPSMVEGFGLTYLEAFRFDKPVIGVDCPATNELVKDSYTGLLIPPIKTEDAIWQQRHAIRLHHFDIDHLIDAMIIMADEASRGNFIKNVKKEKTKYEINKCYRRFLKYFD